MKIKEGFVLRSVMGNNVVVAVGEASKSFRGMIKLNGTAVAIWHLLEEGKTESEIVEAMLEIYDVEREKLAADVKNILEGFEKQGFLEV